MDIIGLQFTSLHVLGFNPQTQGQHANSAQKVPERPQACIRLAVAQFKLNGILFDLNLFISIILSHFTYLLMAVV